MTETLSPPPSIQYLLGSDKAMTEQENYTENNMNGFC